MARISGVDLPRTKRIEIGLTYIFGIGRHRSNVVLTAAGVDPNVRVKDLTEDDVRKITRTTPRRRTTLHLAQIRFTDALTFMTVRLPQFFPASGRAAIVSA